MVRVISGLNVLRGYTHCHLLLTIHMRRIYTLEQNPLQNPLNIVLVSLILALCRWGCQHRKERRKSSDQT
jgi:hypothetical protein